MEIRGAEGGEEANLFARDLYDMYLAYAGNRGWKAETLSHDTSELGGVNQVTFVVRGEDAGSDSSSRAARTGSACSSPRARGVHTSSATVAVLAEADEVDVTIDDRDLDRRLPLVGRGWPARQHDRLGGADHPRAERARRDDAGRAQPAPEPPAR